MSSCLKKSLIALSLTGVMVAPAAYATNGYFAHGYSTKEKGLAGAGVAYSQDSLAIATNPAGIAGMGSRMDVGAAIFNPNRSYTTTGGPSNQCIATGCTFSVGPQSIDSDSSYFLIPHFGYVWNLDATSNMGLAVYGNGGMNSDYKGGTATFFNPGSGTFVSPSGTFGAGRTGVDLSQLFINVAYAKQLNPDHSVGASLVFAYQRFEATGLSNLAAFSSDPAHMSNNDHDSSTGFGFKLGWQGKVTPDVVLGASYQSKMQMSEFSDYAGLFAQGGDFDIPATATIGAAWSIDDSSKLLFDIQTIYFSQVDSIANGIAPLTNGSCDPIGSATNPTGPTANGTGCLGASSGAGFGWEDMTVFKLGYEWGVNDMTMRVGVSHGSQPIPDTEMLFNILAPAVMETHLTYGLTIPMGSGAEFSFAALYAPSNSISGTSPFDPAQTIKLEMDQLELQGSYSLKF